MVHITENEWQQHELECYKDVPTSKADLVVVASYPNGLSFSLAAVLGCLCPLLLYCKNVNDLAKGQCCMFTCLFCIFSPVGICMLRQEARRQYNIEVRIGRVMHVLKSARAGHESQTYCEQSPPLYIAAS